MPFAKGDPLFETFLEPTQILLFGKPFSALTYDPNPPGVKADGDADSGQDADPEPGQVQQALRRAKRGGIFARIYGFSFEGHYYKLPRPILFLVEGEGDGRSRSPENETVDGVRGFSTRFSGVEAKDWQFGSDIRVWAVDKYDMAVCLDLDVATYDEILLQSQTGGQEENAFRTGAAARTGAASRTGAAFRTGAVGLHQDR